MTNLYDEDDADDDFDPPEQADDEDVIDGPRNVADLFDSYGYHC